MTQETEQARYLAWDACLNAREVGGYTTESGQPVRWQTLIRTDGLHRLTPEGKQALRDYGIRTVIDLRLAEELERDPNPFAGAGETPEDAPRYLHLPLHDEATLPALADAKTQVEVYTIILEMNKPLVAAVIEAVADGLDKGGVLVHCHGGKDRTGIVIAMLLSLVGVSRDIIAEDYSHSAERLEPVHAAWLQAQEREQGKPVERPRWMFSPPETIRGTLDYLDGKYGGVEGYLLDAGVSPESIARIREHLVNPGDQESGIGGR